VGAMVTIMWLLRREGEGFGHQVEVEVEQKGAMKEEAMLPAALGVAGELEGIDGEIGMAFALDWPSEQGGQGALVAAEDKLVGGGDSQAGTAITDSQDQGVIKDAGPLKHCATASAASVNRDALAAAERKVHLGGDFIGVTDHNEIPGRFPKPEQFMGATGLAKVEERFVGGEVFGRGGQREVAAVHEVKGQNVA